MVWLDNVSAIFISSNMTATSYTYDVDTRYKSDVQYIEDDVMKIMFVKSSDILTKTTKNCVIIWLGFLLWIEKVWKQR